MSASTGTESQSDYTLRPMVRSDLELVLDWRNQDRIREVMYTDHVISWEEHLAWFERIAGDPTTLYRIFERRGCPAGVVGITNLDAHNGTASWGYYLGSTDVPRGTGSRMEYLALEWAFRELGLRKLCGEVLGFNARVLHLHGKFGFTQEGLLRKQRLKSGEFKDVVLIALFADEWGARRDDMRDTLFDER